MKMEPSELAREFLLEQLGIDMFEFSDVADWMWDEDHDEELTDDVWDALKVEIEKVREWYEDDE